MLDTRLETGILGLEDDVGRGGEGVGAMGSSAVMAVPGGRLCRLPADCLENLRLEPTDSGREALDGLLLTALAVGGRASALPCRG